MHCLYFVECPMCVSKELINWFFYCWLLPRAVSGLAFLTVLCWAGLCLNHWLVEEDQKLLLGEGGWFPMLGNMIPGLCRTLYVWKRGEAHASLEQYTEHNLFLLAEESDTRRTDWNRKAWNFSVFLLFLLVFWVFSTVLVLGPAPDPFSPLIKYINCCYFNLA